MLFPFLSAFDFASMLLVGGQELLRPVVPINFYGLYPYLSKTCRFCKFYGPDEQSPTSLSVMDNDQFLLLFICGAVSFITLAVLRVCSLHRLYSLVHLWSYLVIFCKAIDLIALFIYGFLEPITFCWAVSLIALPNPGLQEPVTFVRLSAL